MSRLAKSLLVITATSGVTYVSFRVLFESRHPLVQRTYTWLYDTADELLELIARPAA